VREVIKYQLTGQDQNVSMPVASEILSVQFDPETQSARMFARGDLNAGLVIREIVAVETGAPLGDAGAYPHIGTVIFPGTGEVHFFDGGEE